MYNAYTHSDDYDFETKMKEILIGRKVVEVKGDDQTAIHGLRLIAQCLCTNTTEKTMRY